MKQYAQDWIRAKCGKIFRIKDKSEYKTSVLIPAHEDKAYSDIFYDFIVDCLTVIDISEKKGRSYAQAVSMAANDNRFNADESTIGDSTDNSMQRYQSMKMQ